MMKRWWMLVLLLVAPLVQAASVNAFLDRNHVSLGDTVTLNITTDGALGNPDLSPLQKDFQVLGTSRSSSMQIVNGKTSSTAQLGIALRPLHAGAITIPALSVGGAMTQPLTLDVSSAPSGGQGQVGDRAYMEASVLSSAPYVGQQTVYTVRLYYQPGMQGSLGAPHADGVQFIQLDRDHRYMVQRNGYAYQVLERSWALVPDRSGKISVQGPAFRGQSFGAGNLNLLLQNPNALMNNPNALLNAPFQGFGKPVQAEAPAVSIDARPEPAGAGKPWLPARDVQLQLTGLPANGEVQAGVPLTVTLQISADGLPAAALPEPQLPPIAGARVYPDQVQDATDGNAEWLRATRTRSFAIVPDRDGKLTIPALTLNWWNVVRDRAAQASVPAHTLQVSGAAATAASNQNGVATTNSNAAASTASANLPGSHGTVTATPSRWRAIAIGSVLLWLVLIGAGLYWWWMYRRGKTVDRHLAQVESEPPSPRQKMGAETPDAAGTPSQPRDLQRQALDAARSGAAARCEHALLAWARAIRPAYTNVGALRDALGEQAQRGALDALQRARWKGGDAAAACAQVAAAFSHGFAWRDEGGADVRPDAAVLPPLYPPR